ncbi:MAG: RNB domain-containing ribonuclease, partial [Myxococcota bacterium]
KGAMTGKDYTETLELLESVGKLRVSMAEKRGVVPSDVDERPLHLDKASGKVIVGHEVRLTTEKWNEQISLLANEAVGKELREAGLKALYRTHPEPTAERLDAFRELVDAMGVPWKAEQSLGDYIRGLDPKSPLTPVIEIQAKRVNQPAYYGTTPTVGHSGLKLQDYAHFTAPMRRYTDVIVARILAAKIEGGPNFDPKTAPYQAEDDRTLEQVAALMDGARERSGNIAIFSEKVLSAAYFADKQGETMSGRIIGLRPGKIQVALDGGPTVSANVSTVNASGVLQNPSFLADRGAELVAGDAHYRMGGEVKLHLDAVKNGRTIFSPAA